jgi:hypothetical protein
MNRSFFPSPRLVAAIGLALALVAQGATSAQPPTPAPTPTPSPSPTPWKAGDKVRAFDSACLAGGSFKPATIVDAIDGSAGFRVMFDAAPDQPVPVPSALLRSPAPPATPSRDSSPEPSAVVGTPTPGPGPAPTPTAEAPLLGCWQLDANAGGPFEGLLAESWERLTFHPDGRLVRSLQDGRSFPSNWEDMGEQRARLRKFGAGFTYVCAVTPAGRMVCQGMMLAFTGCRCPVGM